MKKLISYLLAIFFVLNLSSLFAQTVQITEKQVSLVTYPFSDPDPIPNLGKFYPYSRFEGYSDKGTEQKWKMVELENDYIKLWITPEIGGKIWGAVEKATGKEFIYYNHAVKFRDVAMRGPWTSGGLEHNFGVIGHAPTTSSPVDYQVRKNDDGSVSCFVGTIDLPSRTRWSIEVNLPKDKAYFKTRSVWDNPTKVEQSYYNWMNLGVKTSGDLEYSFPGNYFLGHDGKPSPWPKDNTGRKLNFYENNNFGEYKSYHVFGEATGFYGAYWHDDDFGFAHYADYDDKPGKKVWIWGLSDQGMIWERLLTDKDGQYTEIQSGRLFNQAAGESSKTPFKNRGFAPGSTDEWTEYWFPVKGTKGLKYAEPAGSVNLMQDGNSVSLGFCPNEKTDGKLEVRNRNASVFSKEIHSNPLEVTNETFKYNGDYTTLSVWIENKLLFEANRDKYLIKRPNLSPPTFNWETTYGHYIKGKELERQREYKSASEEYKKSLEADPYFVLALTGMANLSYRKTDYGVSIEYALKALSVDTYDPEANMAYALAGLALGDTTAAIDGFSIASAAVSQRSSAFSALGSIAMQQGNYRKAVAYADKSLQFNQISSDNIQLKILGFRKLGMNEKAEQELALLDKKDPLNHFIRFEYYLTDPSAENKTKVQSHITSEMPHETYLEYALWYMRNGRTADVLKVLDLAPQDQPIVLLWEGYLNHLFGQEQQASALLANALEISPQFVFPSRIETLKPLEWAQSKSDNWKLKYYTGLVYLNAGALEKAKELWNGCSDKPDFYPFYIGRSRLSEPESDQAQADIEKALSLARNDWRTGMIASKFYMVKGDNLKAEELAKTFYSKNPQNYYLGLQYAKMLELNKKYLACINLLQKIQVLPNEGATDGRIVWKNANIGNALDLIKIRKYSKALESITRSKHWLPNLGVGKPYDVDERMEDFIAMSCYQILKDRKRFDEFRDKISGGKAVQNLSSGTNDFLTAWLLKDHGNKAEGDRIMKELSDKNPNAKNIQWTVAIYTNSLERAKTLSKELGKKDENTNLMERVVEELLQLGSFCCQP